MESFFFIAGIVGIYFVFECFLFKSESTTPLRQVGDWLLAITINISICLSIVTPWYKVVSSRSNEEQGPWNGNIQEENPYTREQEQQQLIEDRSTTSMNSEQKPEDYEDLPGSTHMTVYRSGHDRDATHTSGTV